ncbi:MAG: DUF134 domain-containing protein [Dehalococcoidales bacterium]|nr:DUF134 domain-containing protein [Dehalococcoidales bacterium]
MPRPPKWRCVSFQPQITFFAPAAVPPHFLEEVCLSFEEVEAIRLKDFEGLGQEESAQRMKISGSTFHRVLESARRKVADALLHGKAIRIEGGNFGMPIQRFRCNRDGHEWQVPFETMVASQPLVCPNCNSPEIQPFPPFGFGWKGPGRGWQRGGR